MLKNVRQNVKSRRVKLQRLQVRRVLPNQLTHSLQLPKILQQKLNRMMLLKRITVEEIRQKWTRQTRQFGKVKRMKTDRTIYFLDELSISTFPNCKNSNWFFFSEHSIDTMRVIILKVEYATYTESFSFDPFDSAVKFEGIFQNSTKIA
ncbi:unnamed protein product [Toxocara canis]|uniref:Uncharacterized protein n=1 Tax=Toxocara canis TaxID=6265 RepID=A0A183US50_TOXCA|nr:unnamed protein product [Toxocara canis]